MNYTYLKVFIENYSLPTLIISGTVALINLLYDKFLAEKLPNTARTFLPFVLSILLYYAYDMIFVVNGFAFSKGTFSAGILSGSLSVIMSSSVYKLKNGKPVSFNTRMVLVENLLKGIVSESNLAVTVNEILYILDSEILSKEQEIINTVKKNAELDIDDSDVKAISLLIVKAVSSVK